MGKISLLFIAVAAVLLSFAINKAAVEIAFPPTDPISMEQKHVGEFCMQIFRHLWNHGSAASRDTKWTEEMGTIYQFDSIPDIDGNQFDFGSLKGKPHIICNVACSCGYTAKGYKNMVEWKTEHANDPFEVIAFPSNSFDQETKDSATIKKYVVDKFGVNFPLMAKGDVNGDNTTPVYQWLKKAFPGDITWNFSSYFLISHEGIPVARFEKESFDEIKSGIAAAVKVAKEAEAANPTPAPAAVDATPAPVVCEVAPAPVVTEAPAEETQTPQ